MRAPEVSVIMPAYNSQAYLREAIDSALAQEDVALEVIVVDDGSSDDTWSILESYGDRIVAVQQNNAGPSAARNVAVARARGRWLAFLDADDLWLPDKVRKQLELAKPGIGLIYTDTANLDESGRVTKRTSEVHTLVEGDIFEALLEVNFITMSSALLLREDYNNLGGMTLGIDGCSDWELWLRHAAAGGRAALHPEALTHYRWHGGQISQKFAARQEDRLEVVRIALREAKRHGRIVPPALERRAFASTWATAAWFAGRADRVQAARWALKAARCDPRDPRHYKLAINALLGRL